MKIEAQKKSVLSLVNFPFIKLFDILVYLYEKLINNKGTRGVFYLVNKFIPLNGSPNYICY